MTRRSFIVKACGAIAGAAMLCRMFDPKNAWIVKNPGNTPVSPFWSEMIDRANSPMNYGKFCELASLKMGYGK